MRRIVLLVSVIVAAVWYFTWRLTTFNAWHPLWSVVFFAGELVGFAWSTIFLVTVFRVAERITPRAQAGLRVDVVVTTYNEPLSIVRRTLMAAIAIDYPHETWLLDDGARDEMRRLADDYGCRYLARRVNTDAKAGNLNHALPYLRGDFIALFDADHVADPRFLERTLGFLRDDRVAFVQTPQEFTNVESYQHFSSRRVGGPAIHEQSLFFHVIQRARDRVNATMLCGTGAVLRRAALDQIGGFTTGSVTEDMKTSVRLHVAGWRSIFSPEILSAGIAPFDGRDFRRQRLRWAQGSLQVWAQEGLIGNRMTWQQRLHYVLHVLNQIDGWRHAVIFYLPAAILLTTCTPIDAAPLPYLFHFLPYFAACIIAYEEFGRGFGRFFESEVYNLARCSIAISATFVVLQRSLPFRVTAKVRRSGMDWIGIMLPWSIFVTNASAAIYAIWAAAAGREHFPSGSLAIVIGWALFIMAIALRAIGRAWRCNHDRRAFARFCFPLRTMIDGRSASVIAVSDSGITIRPDALFDVTARSPEVVIDVDGRRFTMRATLEPRGRDTWGGPLHWNDERDRAQFDLALHHQFIRSLTRTSLAETELRSCESAALSS